MNDSRDFREISDPAVMVVQPLVSVHMLAYRHEAFLAEAIESVVTQECDFPIEVIIAEDCSPDGCLAIALDYQRRYPQLIRVLTGDTNVGMHRNVARFESTTRGKYVAVCEGDDYWCDPKKLSRQIAVFRRHPECSLVFHAAKSVDASNGRTLAVSRLSLHSRVFGANEIILGDGGLIPTASMLTKVDSRAPTPDWQKDAPVGDYAAALRAAGGGKVIYLARVMSVYRTNVPHSWTSRHVPELTSRMDYARKIEAMLLGFNADSNHQFDRAVDTTISKYYSDVLVRLPGTRTEKRRLYRNVSSKLCASDRLLAWLAVNTGIRLTLAKDLLRKSRTLVRLATAYARNERIEDDADSNLPDQAAHP